MGVYIHVLPRSMLYPKEVSHSLSRYVHNLNGG